MKKRGTCQNCKVERDWILYRQFFANGTVTFCWACAVCNQRNPGRSREFWIPGEKVRAHLTEAEIESLPTIMPDVSNRCVRCGNRNAERHHWAPKAIFGENECEQWPKDYLCKSCHELWHTTVTPQLVSHD